MKQAATAPILEELGSPSSLEAQAAALRALKNDVIGHQQRKENWIRQGVIAPLSTILNQQRDNNHPSIRTEAIIIVGSLAQGEILSILYRRSANLRNLRTGVFAYLRLCKFVSLQIAFLHS